MLTSFTSVTVFEMTDRAHAEAGAGGAAAAAAPAAGAAAGAGGGAGGDDDDMEGVASVRLDKDNVDHMSWLYHRALARANKFGIAGVTYNLTMQVVKNIIPAIASTNALISAACVNEALKYRTGCGPLLNNYFMYIGASASGVNSETIAYARNPQCLVCQPPLILRGLDPAQSLGDWLAKLTTEKGLQSPSVSLNGSFLYLSTLHAQHKDNLDKCLGELLESGNMIVVNDKGGKTLKVLTYFAE
jgi:ubiquitin-activating enzyme E1 C